MKETDLSKKGWDFVREVKNDTRARKYRKRAKENFRFYTGNQWDSDDKKKLEEQKRPALTINSILSTINLVSGYQRQNRRDIKVYPRRGGTEKVSRALTELSKHTMDTSNGNYMKSMAFFDGTIGGKGWLSLDLDYNVDPINGDIKVERISPFMMEEDPSADTYDLNKSAKYVIRSQWKTARQIGLIYPDKKKEFENNMDKFHKKTETYGDEVMSVETDSYQEENENSAPYPGPGNKGDSSGKYKYKVRTIFWKRDERVKYLVDLATLTAVPIDKSKTKTISKMIDPKNGMFAGQGAKDFKTIERVVPILHKQVMVGKIILDHTRDPFQGITRFPFVRYAPYWVDGYCFGVVDNLKDPQREKNKRRSQALHILNKNANAGWLGEKNWYAGDEDNLSKVGAEAGINIEYKKGKKPERFKPIPLSNGHVQLSELSERDIKQISGVNADLLGERGKGQDVGIVLQLRQRQGLTVSEILFDNFDYTEKIFNENLIELIRQTDVYSKEEIQAVLQERDVDVDIGKMRSFKVGRYGIKVSDDPNLPTTRLANFQAVLEAVKMGIPIPPEEVIELSNLPNKERILEKMKAQRQAPGQPAGTGSQGQAAGAPPGQNPGGSSGNAAGQRKVPTPQRR